MKFGVMTHIDFVDHIGQQNFDSLKFQDCGQPLYVKNHTELQLLPVLSAYVICISLLSLDSNTK